MEIRESKHGAIVVLTPIGPLLAGDVEGFRASFSSAVERSLGRTVIDVSAMPYVDSAGLECLIDASDAQSERGRSLRLCGTNDTLREVLELTGYRGHFEHYGDVQDATRSFL